MWAERGGFSRSLQEALTSTPPKGRVPSTATCHLLPMEDPALVMAGQVILGVT
jgi:hypothetical protein